MASINKPWCFYYKPLKYVVSVPIFIGKTPAGICFYVVIPAKAGIYPCFMSSRRRPGSAFLHVIIPRIELRGKLKINVLLLNLTILRPQKQGC